MSPTISARGWASAEGLCIAGSDLCVSRSHD
jgi:hypothetical protein